MLAERASRASFWRTFAVGKAPHLQLRHLMRPNSSSTYKTRTRGTEQLVKLDEDWATAVQEEVLAVAPDRPTIPAPCHKLTAANTCAHWLASTSSSSSFSSTGVNAMSLQLTASPLHASSWPAAVGVAADAVADFDSTAMLGRPLAGLSAMEQELAALLDICMAEMSAVGGPTLLPGQSVSDRQSSNIVPWTPAAAPAAAPAPAPAAAPAAATMLRHGLPISVEEEATMVSLPPSGAAIDPREDQLVVVHLGGRSSSSSRNTPSTEAAPAAETDPAALAMGVRYLRLPRQQEEYEAAVQQGLRVEPLKGLQLRGTWSGDSSSSPYSKSSGCLSCEELTWMGQENFKLTGSWEPVPDVLWALPAEEFSEPALVKVEVGVHLPTQPGQRVLLSGNHPTLGSWDLGRAWKLRWSEGHIWRGCFELPADIAAIEFKAVLKSADELVWEGGANKQVKLQGANAFEMQYAFQA